MKQINYFNRFLFVNSTEATKITLPRQNMTDEWGDSLMIRERGI